MNRALITVKTLTAQARDGGPIEIPEGALITPAAQEWLRSAAGPVKHVAPQSDAGPENATLYLVGDDKTSTIRTLLPSLERSHGKVRMLPCHGHIEGCMRAIEDMCHALAKCNKRRGVIVVRSTAIAGCVANKFPSVRAATIARPSALFDVQRRLGANVLVLDPGQFSHHQLLATIEKFVGGASSTEAAIENVITRAGACSGGGG